MQTIIGELSINIMVTGDGFPHEAEELARKAAEKNFDHQFCIRHIELEDSFYGKDSNEFHFRVYFGGLI